MNMIRNQEFMFINTIRLKKYGRVNIMTVKCSSNVTVMAIVHRSADMISDLVQAAIYYTE